MNSLLRIKAISFCVLVAITHVPTDVLGDIAELSVERDTTIYADNTSNSNGAGDFLFAGFNGGNSERRSLIGFDFSSLPSNAIIQSATLTMVVSQANPADFDISLHRLTTDWGESTSDASGGEGGGTAAANGDATWNNNFFPGQSWNNAGGDFLAQPSATQLVGGVGTYSWTSASLANDVQGWINGDFDNFGWALVFDDVPTASSAKRFNSRTNGSNVPVLTIEFTSVPEPSSMLIGLFLASVVATRRRKSA